MRIPASRTLAVVATATLLLTGVTASARAGDAGPSVAQQVSSVTWCRQSNGLMRQVGAAKACKPGESKLRLKPVPGPAGSPGARGATGPQGATGSPGAQGDTGEQGPSDLYPGTVAPQQVVGDTPSTFDTVSVPAGSYLVQFSAFVFNSSAAQNIGCAVFPSSGPALNLPVTHASVVQSSLAEAPISASGWYVAATGTTFALGCAVSGAGQTATLGEVRLSALKVGTVH